MYYIQHKHYTWINWQRWGAFFTEEEAQKAFDYIQILKKVKPASVNGEDCYDSYGMYEYRLSSGA